MGLALDACLDGGRGSKQHGGEAGRRAPLLHRVVDLGDQCCKSTHVGRGCHGMIERLELQQRVDPVAHRVRVLVEQRVGVVEGAGARHKGREEQVLVLLQDGGEGQRLLARGFRITAGDDGEEGLLDAGELGREFCLECCGALVEGNTRALVGIHRQVRGGEDRQRQGQQQAHQHHRERPCGAEARKSCKGIGPQPLPRPGAWLRLAAPMGLIPLHDVLCRSPRRQLRIR